MAKSKKPPRNDDVAKGDDARPEPEFAVPEAEIADAEIVEETAPEDTDASVDVPEDEPQSEDIAQEGDADPEPVAADSADIEASVTEPEPDAESPGIDPVEEPVEARPDPAPVAQPQKNGGFAGGVFGGLLAGLIGFGVATYLFRDTATDPTPDIAANSAAIETLRSDLEALPPAPDLAGLEEGLATLDTRMADLSAQLDTLGTQTGTRLDDLDQRLADLEKAPNADGTLSDQALAAYERELEALRTDMAAQQEQMAALAAQAEAALVDAEAEAQAIEAAARAAASRAALSRLRAALDTGEPFAALVPELGDLGTDLPAALTAVAEDGVPTVQELSAAFPDAARAALAAARAEDADSGGIGAFLRDRFEVRSTVPRDGDDPDAVLSRAEAAVNDGRLSDALAEIETLPESARAAMTDWLARAEARRDAVAAVDTLMQSVSEN